MNSLPSDPMMLMSAVNMKLRDQYASLELLCEDMDVDIAWLTERLASAGFEYNREANKFW